MEKTGGASGDWRAPMKLPLRRGGARADAGAARRPAGRDASRSEAAFGRVLAEDDPRRARPAAVHRLGHGRLGAWPGRRRPDFCDRRRERRRPCLRADAAARARRCASSPARRCRAGADAVVIQEDADARRRRGRRARRPTTGRPHPPGRRRLPRRARRCWQPRRAARCLAPWRWRPPPGARELAGGRAATSRACSPPARRSSPPGGRRVPTRSSTPADRRSCAADRALGRRRAVPPAPVGDDAAAIAAGGARAPTATSSSPLGGASVGDHDLVKPALASSAWSSASRASACAPASRPGSACSATAPRAGPARQSGLGAGLRRALPAAAAGWPCRAPSRPAAAASARLTGRCPPTARASTGRAARLSSGRRRALRRGVARSGLVAGHGVRRGRRAGPPRDRRAGRRRRARSSRCWCWTGCRRGFTATISPITEIATSQGALPPRSSPIGVRSRASVGVGRRRPPASRASRSGSRRRAPSTPT